VHDRRQREVDRALLADFNLVEIADRGPFLDPAGPLNRAGVGEKGLGQRRLPAPEWPTSTTLRTLSGWPADDVLPAAPEL